MGNSSHAVILLVLLFVVYFLPALIADLRKHHNGNAITMLNLLLGWTVLGWIIAMVWACTVVQPHAQAESRS